MKLETEFYKLPLCYDVDRLVEEVTGFAEEEWRPHPQAYEGNSAMILVSAHGDQNDDMQGPMMPTDKLARCPYIQQVLASLDTVIGRSRLMRLGPEAKVPEHSDIHYYWYNHLRVHIPIITDPSIRFCCNGQEVNMAAGEAWTFNNWRQHTVINPSGVTRIHLVADTTGSAVFWDLLQRAERPFDPENSVQSEPELIPYSPDATADFPIERVNAPVVMHPGELDLLLGELRADLGAAESVPDEATKEFFEVLDRLRRDWRCAWAVYAEDESGWPQYRSLIQRALDQAERVDGDLPMASNGTPAKNVLNSTLGAALNPGLKPSQADPTAATVAAPAAQAGRPAFERPVFIVAAPRSGSTLLFETMARNRGLWTIGGESHQEFEAIPGLNPASSIYHSNRLTEADADPATAATLMDAFAAKLQHADGNQLHQYPQEQRPTAIRFLEKTPKNALRIPFMRAVFPDALPEHGAAWRH